MKLATQCTLILACLCQPAFAQSTPGAESSQSSITPLPGRNAWQIREVDTESDSVRAFRYVLQNKIDPLIRSTIDTDEEGRQFLYHYRLSNGKQAEQNIDYFWICCVPLQVFIIPPDESYPKKTGDKVKDEAAMNEWRKRSRDAAKLIIGAGKRYLRTPEAWRPSLKQGDGSAGYGWLPRIDTTIPTDKRIYGMPPGTWAEGFAFPRPELPGVRMAKLQGFTKNDQLPGSYDIETEDPKLKAEIAAIARADGRWIPVLAPVLGVAEPFNAAAFARQLWSEIEDKWYREDDYSLSLMAPKTFAQFQQEFGLLLAELESNHNGAAKVRTDRMLAQLAQMTAPNSITSENASDEQSTNDTAPLPTTRGRVTDPDNTDAATHNIHRVAARALVFNLAYLRRHLRSEK
ncbi:hypothetical protein J8I26_01345 [Herbaspirillum sp. LeCh32-8]|uniref:hypothetical protein n=1 Tax=Herbaspirillum sp. LeCh32-8 TaxID=2821356 RepID=UPI001AE2FA84|nr:hypothetical protein [Herbaspirillum sp. LeCh32-8]MBP0596734.1 hypothetical protein [Herbaspirillum sp. LeCh32-8]